MVLVVTAQMEIFEGMCSPVGEKYDLSNAKSLRGIF